MSICERCQKNPARVRIDQMVSGQRESRYLCQPCVDEVMSTMSQKGGFEGLGLSGASSGVSASNQPSSEPFMQQATTFLQALVAWQQQLPTVKWDDFLIEARQSKVALVSVDMINGFCHEGALSSPRVQGIIPAVVAAFKGAFALGVRNFILAQDCHSADATEFADFPPHCQIGTSEAETIPELAQLPFADLFTIVAKNSLSAFHNTSLAAWLEEHRDLRTFVVVGDCTDLCVYQMAMYLKLHANAHNLPLRVIVPANAVQTYDMPVDVAKSIGALPHDGDVTHLFFLYHMRLNGVEVVREIAG